MLFDFMIAMGGRRYYYHLCVVFFFVQNKIFIFCVCYVFQGHVIFGLFVVDLDVWLMDWDYEWGGEFVVVYWIDFIVFKSNNCYIQQFGYYEIQNINISLYCKSIKHVRHLGMLIMSSNFWRKLCRIIVPNVTKDTMSSIYYRHKFKQLLIIP